MGGFINKDVCSSQPSTNCHNKYSGDTYYHNDKVVRIVMVGKTGAGKSATGNTILGHKYFKSKFSLKSLTKDCAKAVGEVDGQKVAVIDTPGLFDTSIDEEKTRTDVGQSIRYASPGPHVFLVVIRLGRFTAEERQSVQKIQEIFGEPADRYSMVLFTHGDLLEDQPIEELLKESEELQELVARCNGQYHVFNNDLKDRSQVRELLGKIRNIAEKNGGSHYTNEMFQEVERKLEEEKQRILKEREEEMRKEQEEMQKKISEKYEQQMKEMKDDRERSEKLHEAREREMEEKSSEKYEQQMKEMKDDRERMKKLLETREREMEKKRSEKYEQQMKEMKDDRERSEKLHEAREREMEKKSSEKYEQQMKEMKDDRERMKKLLETREREMEKKRSEKYEQHMKEMKDDRERMKKLLETREREMVEERRRLREEQERRARQEAENTPYIIRIINGVIEFFTG